MGSNSVTWEGGLSWGSMDLGLAEALGGTFRENFTVLGFESLTSATDSEGFSSMSTVGNRNANKINNDMLQN